MMIGFIALDSKCSVQLFCEKRPDHLVGKSHFGKRYFPICPVINCLREPVRASNHENQLFQTRVHLFLEKVRKLHRTEGLTSFIE